MQRKRCAGAEIGLAGERPVLGDDAQAFDRVHARTAGVVERDAREHAGARAGAPFETLDADVLDPDLERQREALRHRRRGIRRCLERERDAVRAEAGDMEATREQVGRAIGERHRLCLDVDVVAGPRDARDAHGRQQRSFRALDGEAPLARGNRACDHPIERGLAPEEGGTRRGNRDGERANAGDDEAPLPPADGRARRDGGWRGLIHPQNERPTEKCTRTLWTSWPYATSMRNGPIGVRRRAPMP